MKVLKKIEANLNTQKVFYFALFISISVFLFSFIRDWELDTKRLPCDLRNRVIGARLLFTDESPYFYKWQNDQPVELYDLGHNREIKVSAVTVSPFFLLLLKPISYFSYFTISKFWLVFEYFNILIILIISIFHSRNFAKKSLTSIFICFFTLSNTWQYHVDLGQYYIIFPTFYISIYALLFRDKSSNKSQILAATLSIIMVLIRPISIVSFIPILLLTRNLRCYFLASLTLASITITIITINPNQRKLWTDHIYSINYTKQFHLGEIKANTNLKPLMEPRNIEGYDMNKVIILDANPPYKEYFVNYYKFPEEIGLKRLTMNEVFIHYVIFFCLLTLFGFYLIFKTTNYRTSLEITFCLGVILYLATEIFIPINRASYNQVQWLSIISMVCTFYSVNKTTISLIATLNILMILNIKQFESQIISSEIFAFFIILSHLVFLLFKKREITETP